MFEHEKYVSHFSNTDHSLPWTENTDEALEVADDIKYLTFATGEGSVTSVHQTHLCPNINNKRRLSTMLNIQMYQ